MFQQRQSTEINPLSEISFVTLSPGAVTNGSTVYVTGACKLGAAGSAFPATFALGDQLEVYPASGSATNGVLVSAAPTATGGTAGFYFQNNTGGSITPVASSVYTVVATRYPANLVS